MRTLSNNRPTDSLTQDLYDLGLSLHLLKPHSKVPANAKWSTADRTPFDVIETGLLKGQNVGFRPGESSRTQAGYVHVVDFDVREESRLGEAQLALSEILPNCEDFPIVVSGSGGSSRHFYIFLPAPYATRKLAKSDGCTMVWDERKGREVKKNHWEIDLLGTGKNCVLPNSIHPDTGKRYHWIKPPDLNLLKLGIGPNVPQSLLYQLKPTAPQQSRLLAELLGDVEPVDWAKIESALDAITGTDDRDVWLRIGAALYHESGGSDEGRSLWDDWSKQSDKFDAGDQHKTWRSFGRGYRGAKCSGGTIFDLAAQNGWTAGIVVEADDFDDLPELPVTDGGALRLMRLRNGDLRATLHNAILKLEAVDRQRGFTIRRNQMTLRDEWCGGVIGDADRALIRVAIEQAGMHCVGSELTVQAVRAVAEKNPFHPVRDYLRALKHDGRSRLDAWLSDYLSIVDSPYVRAVGRAFLVAMVARIMRPGCKHDAVLVLRGAQGLRKSTACSILGRTWFGDNMPSIRDGGREAGLYLRGHWLIELAELAPSRKAEAEDLKSFLSRGSDEIRAPYARTADVVPRQCVFVGTSNEDAILRDTTGGRRFWPVTVESQIDTDALARDRDQIFAEAVVAFDAGEAWHLSPEVECLAAEAQEEAREVDPWEDVIRDWVNSEEFDGQRCESVAMQDLLWKALEIPTDRQSTPVSRRAGSILRMMGFVRSRKAQGHRIWVRGEK